MTAFVDRHVGGWKHALACVGISLSLTFLANMISYPDGPMSVAVRAVTFGGVGAVLANVIARRRGWLDEAYRRERARRSG